MATTQQDSTDWFYNKASSAGAIRKNIASNTERSRDSTVIGKMYFFYYDAKMKKVLPMYDRFPLVFPIERYADGFLGLNLHYLYPAERQAFLNKLKEFTNNKKYNETTRLRMTYDLLASTKSLAASGRPCIKRYLFGHVRSKFIEIPANEWDKAIDLPVALFVYNK